MQQSIVSDDLILHTDATLQLVQNANTVMEGSTEVNAICVRLVGLTGSVLRDVDVSLMAVVGTAGKNTVHPWQSYRVIGLTSSQKS